jgi:hypothetical protein
MEYRLANHDEADFSAGHMSDLLGAACIKIPTAKPVSLLICRFKSDVVGNRRAANSGPVGNPDAPASCLRSFRGGLSQSFEYGKAARFRLPRSR